MPIDSFPSFRKNVYAQVEPENINSPSVFNGPQEGEILKLYKGKDKYRADVRLFSGPILSKVRLAGPFYNKQGMQHGHKIAYKKGQRVKITFIENRRDIFVADVVYSLPGGEKETTNLDLAEYDPEEVSTGHESGHKTIWEDGKTIFQDKAKQVYLEIDYSKDEITLKTKTGKIKVTNTEILVETTLAKSKVSDKEIIMELGNSKLEITNTGIKLNASKITITNGLEEFDLLTHVHTSGAPGTPTSKTTNGS